MPEGRAREMDATIAAILDRMGDRVQSVTSTYVYGNKQSSTTVVLAPAAVPALPEAAATPKLDGLFRSVKLNRQSAMSNPDVA
ncbi:hypothetical protein GCM10010994_31770 [Chelatococcus reniformis]|uniref:Uncharacterized protein n=2 Tax=Chelatococcus reniformis TaxID=1494448 RepID=A0A916UEY5_9HYPH|nr:hypothetical protein GCM10010994_31770 [Chelatococcus reniformis]